MNLNTERLKIEVHKQICKKQIGNFKIWKIYFIRIKRLVLHENNQ